MCLQPRQIKRRLPDGSTRVDVVSCGRCSECLRRKQQDYAFIISRQFRASGSGFLVTLTYSNDRVPMAAVYDLVDGSSGVVLDSYCPGFVMPEYESLARQRYYSVYSHSGHEVPFNPEYGPLVDFQDYVRRGTYSGKSYYMRKHVRHGFAASSARSYGAFVTMSVCPSLRRSDVRSWLKSSREAYYRKFGVRPVFKYFAAGEYGPKTSRPHFHLVFTGISRDVLDFFCARWSESFGNVDVQPVRPLPGDSIDSAFERVGRYVGKYVAKGSFDSANSIAKRVERPRRFSSLRFGTSNLGDIRSYCLAFDVFGEYDPDHPPRKVMANLDLILERRYMLRMSPAGQLFKIRIPKIIYEKVLSKTYCLSKEEKQNLGFCSKGKEAFVYRVSHQRSFLQHIIAKRIKEIASAQFNEVVESASRFKSLRPSSQAFRAAMSQKSRSSETLRASVASDYWKTLRGFYNNSIY